MFSSKFTPKVLRRMHFDCIYLINRTLSKLLRGKTTFELLFGKCLLTLIFEALVV